MVEEQEAIAVRLVLDYNEKTGTFYFRLCPLAYAEAAARLYGEFCPLYLRAA